MNVWSTYSALFIRPLTASPCDTLSNICKLVQCDVENTCIHPIPFISSFHHSQPNVYCNIFVPKLNSHLISVVCCCTPPWSIAHNPKHGLVLCWPHYFDVCAFVFWSKSHQPPHLQIAMYEVLTKTIRDCGDNTRPHRLSILSIERASSDST